MLPLLNEQGYLNARRIYETSKQILKASNSDEKEYAKSLVSYLRPMISAFKHVSGENNLDEREFMEVYTLIVGENTMGVVQVLSPLSKYAFKMREELAQEKFDSVDVYNNILTNYAKFVQESEESVMFQKDPLYITLQDFSHLTKKLESVKLSEYANDGEIISEYLDVVAEAVV